MRANEHRGWVQRARAVPIETEIERRGIKLRREGLERVGPCPKCGGDDRFAINTKKQVFNCRGCGICGDVIQLVEDLDGIDFNTACTRLTGQPPPRANGKANGKDTSKKVVVATFEYRDRAGNVLFVVDRIEFQKPDGDYVLKDGKRDKVFRQRRPDPDHPGKWLPNVTGVPVVPYRLPQVLEAIAAGCPALIVEGEAKADLLWSWNVAATCCAGGAKKWKPEHSEFLRGADIVLVPDHDEAGWQHINSVGASLTGTAQRVRVLVLPDLRPKGDVIDWAKASGSREQLDALIDKAPDWTPPAKKADELDKENKDRAAQSEEGLLDALARMAKGVKRGRERKRLAKEFGVNPSDIDAEIEARRTEVEIHAPLHGHWFVEPWPEPADGDALIRDIIRKLQKHIVISHDGALAIALWIMLAWAHDEVATHSPILNITSAEPDSGKTTTLGVVSFLVPRAISSVDISRAALYRSIQRWQPSFVIDEFDDVLAAKADGDKAELRSVINSGHTRNHGVLRCITDEHKPEMFSTFCPKAIGMIGRKMPATTLGRCIIVEVRRRKKGEPVEKFKHEDDGELRNLRSRLRRWSMDNTEALRGSEPSMPDGFENRRADNWRVQFAIADLCSGAEDWSDKARLAAAKLEGASDVTSIGVRLLADIKRIFDEDGCDCILSATLVVRLKEDVEQPWADWNKGKGLTQNSLAVLLGGGGGRGRASRGGFGIRSDTVHPSPSVQGKGYKRSQFEDVWSRYLPEEISSSSQGGE
jgi:putative DNA primase/helicase